MSARNDFAFARCDRRQKQRPMRNALVRWQRDAPRERPSHWVNHKREHGVGLSESADGDNHEAPAAGRHAKLRALAVASGHIPWVGKNEHVKTKF